MARWIDLPHAARVKIARSEARKIDFAAWAALIDADEAKARATRTGVLLELALEQIERDREAMRRQMMDAAK